MSTKEEILSRYRRNMKVKGQYDMPDLDALKGIEYADAVSQFIAMSRTVGGEVVTLEPGADVNEVIRKAYPEEDTPFFGGFLFLCPINI